MILVDREIRALSEEELGLIRGFDQSCLSSVGYDLRTEYFVVDKKERQTAVLLPGESVFVASREAVQMPTNLLGRVYLRNSRIRQGLSLESPVYQPGHFSKVFFRLRNLSNNEIELSTGEKYAMIVFEQLTGEPDKHYGGTFQEEIDFKGLADYKEIYEKQMNEINRKTEDLKNIERSIYANVLVILTVFVALFSFMTANLGFFSEETTAKEFLVGNFILLGSISFLVAMLRTTIEIKKYKGFEKWAIWVAVLAFFGIALWLFV